MDPKGNAVITDDRAQYKKTLNNFLAREAKNKKGGGAANEYSSGDTDSEEDKMRTMAKVAGGASGSDEK